MKNQNERKTRCTQQYAIFIIGCLIVTSSLLTRAAGNDSIEYPKLNKTYIKSYWHDTKSFVVSPAKWRTKQWIEFGVVAGAGVIAYTQEVKMWNYFVAHQYPAAENMSKYVFEPFGNYKVSSVLIGSLYLGGRLSKDKRLAGTSLVAAKSFIVSAVFAKTIKELTHRHYDYTTGLPVWDGPFSDSKSSSFPSGHATVAFSFATVFASEYKSTIWVPVLMYTLATGAAVERLYNNNHWASEVVVGSALGFVTGRFMWKQLRKAGNNLVILPTASTQSASVTFLLRLNMPKQHMPNF